MSASTDGQQKAEDESKSDPFEVATGFLLGLAAIGAALSSLQAGQWGGKQLEAFSQSNTMQTLASRDYNEAVSSQNADYAIIARAKELLIDAAEADTEVEEQRKLRVVSYLYSEQLTWQAMKALGLSEDLWSAERSDEAGDAAAAPGADAPAPEPEAAPAPEPAPPADEANAEPVDEPTPDSGAATAEGDPAADPAAPAEVPAEPDSAGETAIDAALDRMLPEELLWRTIDVELHDEDSTYGDDLFSEAIAKFDEADAKFREGQTANDNGDKFDLAGVYYTVALFFAGLGLVFKSRIRWPFFGLGVLIFLGTSVFVAMLPWAG